jgi:hypothetical protein
LSSILPREWGVVSRACSDVKLSKLLLN